MKYKLKNVAYVEGNVVEFVRRAKKLETENKPWLCETTCIVTKTILIYAPTKKEALKKLKAGEGEGINVHYGPIRAQRVVGRGEKDD